MPHTKRHMEDPPITVKGTSGASVGPWGAAFEDDGSQGGLSLGQRVPRNPDSFDATKLRLSSAERNVWSKRNPIWKLNRVDRPRTATIEDDNKDWSAKYRPASFGAIMGTHHSDAAGCLQSLIRREQLRNLVIAGPPGCGKTTLVEIFIKEYFGQEGEDGGGKVLRLSCSDLSPSHQEMKPIFDDFLADLDRKKEPKASRLVVIDHFSDADPMVQSNIQRFVEGLVVSTRFIFIAASAKKVLDRIRTACVTVLIKAIPASLTLQIVCGVCIHERIGFDKGGLQAIFKEAGGNINRFLEVLHEVFMRYDYVSEENVIRHLCPKQKDEKTPISVFASLQPLSRCEKCTLVPPCKHITEDLLLDLAVRRRNDLPRYKDALVCRHFAKSGACPLFNREGHCSLDHPKNLHILEYPVSRCKLCTLPYPCGVCKYDQLRGKAKGQIEAWKNRLALLQRKLESPAGFVPPVVLERLKLEAKIELKRIDREIDQVVNSPSTDLSYYKVKMAENQTAMTKYLQLVNQYPVEYQQG